MTKIVFVFHGKFKGSKQIARIEQVFGSGYQLEFMFTEFAGHATALAKQAVLEGAEIVIAAGGDGTNNEVANGIMQAGNPNVKMGLLPYGTGNDFAKSVKVTDSIEALKALIESSAVKQIDLGRLNYKNEQGADASCYFINITDVGLGGFIAKKIAGSGKRLGAFITFQKAIVTTFLTYKHMRV
ncbi:MAG: acylglycerol kinase family protein, partial [Chitinophagales bacterium]|nr:acylglycerol kinase family protein [Chitinophagales bacterium]